MQKNKQAELCPLALESALKNFKPLLIPNAQQFKQAAVCLVVSQCITQNDKRANLRPDDLCVLMIRRAKHFSDPWSGHMAFPGGRIETTDASVKAGGLRELKEELAVDDVSLSFLGRLSDIQANHIPGQKGLVISPFVFFAEELLAPEKNYEVAEYHWIPLKFFLKAQRRNMFWFKGRKLLKLPYYKYNKRRVWGLSLAMIDEMFEVIDQPLALNNKWRKRYKHRALKVNIKK